GGAITGYYFDAIHMPHGFLRAADGNITTFDVPGALLTVPESINPAREITGFYFADPGAFLPHAFLRDANGTFTTFNVIGAAATYALSINPAGAITGYYLDASLESHG